MFLKIVATVICKALIYFLGFFKMGNRNSVTNNKTMDPYKFKIFQFEIVKPNRSNGIPLPRSGHRIVSDSANLYSFGGYNPLILNEEGSRDEDDFAVNSYPLFQELWKFNFASKNWKRYNSRQTLPQELASNAVIREGNFLMVFGGTGSPFGYRCSNQLYICRLNDETGEMFEVTTTGQLPLPQYGQALLHHNNYLYTIGGTTGFSYTCDIHRLHIGKKVWENIYICQGQSDLEPVGRYRHEIAFDGKNIYILGGGTADEAFDFYEIPVFNIETRQWQKIRTKRDPQTRAHSPYRYVGVPLPRRCHGAVQIQTENDIHVFVTGGYDGDLVFDDLWRLELSTMQWRLIERCTLPWPTYFHSASVTPEGKLYVFGGIYADENIRRNNDIVSTWLCIPKLSEMCWEALLHYYPKIVNCPKNKLINAGLPRHFVQRLE
ncbi:kelch domain-containing protein 10 homolog isoform X2 [Agrilus planipennis]|uniref:Kelch domain-containing protein 10 homolog isoform X2 n=1 Tax=Agrilus planipennis TaxID=224129 RepID=A0A1W4WJ89_AGRPL|nr:kelch domain-containing protein 10 homolog isoform X2 [Agrilus planipennis]